MLHRVIFSIIVAAIFGVGTSALASELKKVGVEGDWELYILGDPFSGEVNGIVSEGTTANQVILVKCDEDGGAPYVVFAVDEYLDNGENGKARLRFDGGDIETFQGWKTDSKFIIFSRTNASQFSKIITQLMAASKVAIEVYSYDFDRSVAVYPVNGFPQAIQHVEKTCKFPSN